MARCWTCNKFRGVELADPEISSEAVDSVGNVTADIRLVLTCEECGEELKEGTETIDFVMAGVADHVATHESMTDLDIICESSAIESFTNGNNKHFYGADVDVTVICRECGETFENNLKVYIQASNFEDLY